MTYTDWDTAFRAAFDRVEPYLDDDGLAPEAPADDREEFYRLQQIGAEKGYLWAKGVAA